MADIRNDVYLQFADILLCKINKALDLREPPVNNIWWEWHLAMSSARKFEEDSGKRYKQYLLY